VLAYTTFVQNCEVKKAVSCSNVLTNISFIEETSIAFEYTLYTAFQKTKEICFKKNAVLSPTFLKNILKKWGIFTPPKKARFFPPL